VGTAIGVRITAARVGVNSFAAALRTPKVDKLLVSEIYTLKFVGVSQDYSLY